MIGSGFIGTVHIEALRRIGVKVQGLLGSSPERGQERAARLGVAAGLRQPRRPAQRSSGRGRPRHLAQPPAPPAGQADPRRRPARGLREAAGDDLGESRRAGRAGGRRPDKVAAVNFNIRFYPLNQHARDAVHDGALGDVRLISGRYFQDWLLMETDWNWRLAARPGRRAPRGRRHRLALARPDDVHHRAPCRVGDGRPGDLHHGRASSPPARSRRSRRSAPPTRSRRAISTEDAATSCCATTNGARGSWSLSQISAGPQELTPVRDRRLGRRRGVGLRAARPAVAGPSRQAERDPDQRTRR